MIKLQVIGNIGKDATSQQISGNNYAKFSLAVRIDKDKTEWIDCLKLDKESKLAPYLTKGKTIFVEGRPSASAYKNKEEKIVSSLTIWVNEIEFIASPKAPEATLPTISSKNPDDLPF